MQRPLISVIMTILNGADTLTACLESIACQSFVDYEVVIVDGGSTDETINIIKAKPIRRLTLREMPGIGLYAGLNAGIDVAVGEWYYFIGCDDRLFTCNVLHQVSSCLKASSEARQIVAGKVYYPKSKIVTNPQTWGFLSLTYRLHHQGLFYNQSLFEALRYNALLSFSADYEMNMKHIVGKVQICFVKVVIAMFGEEGESSRNLKEAYLERQLIHDEVFNGLTLVGIKVIAKIQYNTWLLRKQLKSAMSSDGVYDRLLDKIRAVKKINLWKMP